MNTVILGLLLQLSVLLQVWHCFVTVVDILCRYSIATATTAAGGTVLDIDLLLSQLEWRWWWSCDLNPLSVSVGVIVESFEIVCYLIDC